MKPTAHRLSKIRLGLLIWLDYDDFKSTRALARIAYSGDFYIELTDFGYFSANDSGYRVEFEPFGKIGGQVGFWIVTRK